ncbi:MAG: leucyl aminopeptidase family protein [Alphaproteobacteria bacterium]|nr:leucyl aminopeptidase family protein [Alphaproteobacteria bacterium]
MLFTHLIKKSAKSIPLIPLTSEKFPLWLKEQPKETKLWIETHQFTFKESHYLIIPHNNGHIKEVILGISGKNDIWSYGHLPFSLPKATYRIDDTYESITPEKATLGWALGGYLFERYKKNHKKPAQLLWPKNCDSHKVLNLASAIFLVRDLINTPAEDMGPAHIAEEAKKITLQYKAKISVITGDDLLKKNYPAIHAVGRASDRAPRLIDINWGNRGKKIVLVGKGVCFDTGGLDIKSASNMQLMKKDMGGAAHVLALASLIMAHKLPIQLRVLIPTVDNNISGNAYRPMDVLNTRHGLTVEIGNTDAEGRVILCDALSEANKTNPDLIIDCATLTGAAGIALGPDLPALFCNDDFCAENLLKISDRENDLLWRMPLYKPYLKMLESRVADINNCSDSGLAGAITAALFLEKFIHPKTPWIHLDLRAWNFTNKPGRPIGGEAMGLRALYSFIEFFIKHKK